jgi:hypothetical protein
LQADLIDFARTEVGVNVRRKLAIGGLLLVIVAGAALIVIESQQMGGSHWFGSNDSRTVPVVRPPIKAFMIRAFRNNNTSLLGKMGPALPTTTFPGIKCGKMPKKSP